MLPKNRNLKKIDVLKKPKLKKIEILKKIDILKKNRHFEKKSKFWVNVEIFAYNFIRNDITWLDIKTGDKCELHLVCHS